MSIVIPMNAETITAITASVATIAPILGGGVAWLFKRMDAKFEKRVTAIESSYKRLRHAFQLVANELYKLDPANPTLLRAHEILADVDNPPEPLP